MSVPYIEDNGDEFPINNLVRCGQAAFDVDTGESLAKVVAGKSPSRAPLKVGGAKFFPKALPLRK